MWTIRASARDSARRELGHHGSGLPTPYLYFCQRDEGIVLKFLLELLWKIGFFLEANASVAGLVRVLPKESLSASSKPFTKSAPYLNAIDRHAAAHMKTLATSAVP